MRLFWVKYLKMYERIRAPTIYKLKLLLRKYPYFRHFLCTHLIVFFRL